MTRFLGLLGVSLLALSSSAHAQKPNIIVIMTDDQRWDDIATMPKLQSIAAQGLTFENSFAAFPVCGPARASFLTGQYAHHHGQQDNSPQSYEKIKAREDNTLGVWMQEAGYNTGIMGKMVNGWGTQPHDIPGWDTFRGLIPRPSGGYDYFDFSMWEGGALRPHPGEYITNYLTKKAQDFISDNLPKPEPFFLVVTPNAPHEAWNGPPVPAPKYQGSLSGTLLPTPPNFNEPSTGDKPHWIRDLPLLSPSEIDQLKLDNQARKEALLSVDDMAKTLVEAAKGEPTIFIYTSDNGYSLGSHRWKTKYVVYDESTRVPLIIAGPGVPPGKREQLVSNLDMVATILDLAGAPPPPDGHTLTPFFTNTNPPWDNGVLLSGEYPKWGTNHYFAIRTPTSLYAETQSILYGKETELYDLTTDPYQLRNKSKSLPARRTHLAKKLKEKLS